jgi:N6-L-threonylcarbamoyladenine synthase
VPYVGVNHLEAHLLAIFLHREIEFPYLALLASGGHTLLYVVRDFGDYRYLGGTRDDAAGEAYDKVAKMMGLGYPGGRVIDQLSKSGNAKAIKFPRARMKKGAHEFSFSGLKTAVLRYIRAHEEPLTDAEIANICASFQRVVVNALIDRSFDAARRIGAKSIGVAGGVSANSRLRAELKTHGEAREMPTFVPSLRLSTDNAAMIAAAGLRKLRSGVTAPLDLNADAALPL